jgi:hypothetical protein
MNARIQQRAMEERDFKVGVLTENCEGALVLRQHIVLSQTLRKSMPLHENTFKYILP